MELKTLKSILVAGKSCDKLIMTFDITICDEPLMKVQNYNR